MSDTTYFDEEFLDSKDEEIIQKLQTAFPYQDIATRYVGGVESLHKDTYDVACKLGHSLRELIYRSSAKNSPTSFLQEVTSVLPYNTKGDHELGALYGIVTDLAHHNQSNIINKSQKTSHLLYGTIKSSKSPLTREELIGILNKAKHILLTALHHHINAQRRIKTFLETKEEIDYTELFLFLKHNQHLREYLFTHADETWIEWLCNNEMFETLNKFPEETGQRTYYPPEQVYLSCVASEAPSEVQDIVLSFNLPNEEERAALLITRLLPIVRELPAKYLPPIIEKISQENWVQIGSKYNHEGFEYSLILENLYEAHDFKSLLSLIDTILTVQSETELSKQKPLKTIDLQFFYFNDLSRLNVFSYLESLASTLPDQAYSLILNTLSTIYKRSKVFSYTDQTLLFNFYDLNLFDIKQTDPPLLSGLDNVTNLLATLTTIFEQICSIYKNNPEHLLKKYREGLIALPKISLRQRWKIFMLRKIREYSEETSGTIQNEVTDILFDLPQSPPIPPEYTELVRREFESLSNTNQSTYLSSLCIQMSKDPYFISAKRLLSYLRPQLSQEQIEHVEEVFGDIIEDSSQHVSPHIRTQSGFVSEQPEGTDREWTQTSIPSLVGKLKSDWAPEQIKQSQEAQQSDPFSPINEEGTAQRLGEEVKNRPQEFLEHANLLFAPEILSPLYTKEIMKAFSDLLERNPTTFKKHDLHTLIEFIQDISSYELDKSPSKEDRAHLNSIFSYAAKILKNLLTQIDNLPVAFTDVRDTVFESLANLLQKPDPSPNRESLEHGSTISKPVPNSNERINLVSNPLTIAINSVRGIGFEAFLWFTHHEGEMRKETEDTDTLLSERVKNLYSTLLENEDTRALHFMFGHYLQFFYLRDKEWTRSIFPKLFPEHPEAPHLFVAAWEGYLAQNLLRPLFLEPHIQKTHQKMIQDPVQDNLQRDYFKPLDEGLAHHMAIGITHFEEFDFENDVFSTFWKDGNTEQHTEFVSFIGKSIISAENNTVDNIRAHFSGLEKRLEKLWEMYLHKFKDREILNQFGFWLNLDKELFEVKWLSDHTLETMKRMNGPFEWEVGFERVIKHFAQKTPKNCVKILRYQYHKGLELEGLKPLPPRQGEDEYEAFRILYENEDTRDDTYTLINDLIRDGGAQYWPLENIVFNE